MKEKLQSSKNRRDAISRGLERVTGIPQGDWMLKSVHPDLGGGTLFTLTNFIDRGSCIYINDQGIYLWRDRKDNRGYWKKTESLKTVENWSKKAAALRKPLHQPSVETMRAELETL